MTIQGISVATNIVIRGYALIALSRDTPKKRA